MAPGQVLGPAHDPLGKRFFMPELWHRRFVTEQTRWLTVVGVVPEVRFVPASRAIRHRWRVSCSRRRRNRRIASYNLRDRIVRHRGRDPMLRAEIAHVDPALVLTDVRVDRRACEPGSAARRLAMSSRRVRRRRAVPLCSASTAFSRTSSRSARTRSVRSIALGSTCGRFSRSSYSEDSPSPLGSCSRRRRAAARPRSRWAPLRRPVSDPADRASPAACGPRSYSAYPRLPRC